MKTYSHSPFAMFGSFWRQRTLIKVLTVREVASRYRGSFLGILWSFLNPVFMLAVYTFVFSVVFKARWGQYDESRSQFALILFAGLIFFNLFAECINRAPHLVQENTNYVKKVVFPLEILPWISFGAAFFHALVSFLVWTGFYVVVWGVPHGTIMLLPLLLLPFCFFILGLSWFFSSLGVYIRDVGQVLNVIVTILMFLTPIFYPLSAIPPKFRIFLYLNPLTFIVEQARFLMVFGQMPEWKNLIFFSFCSLLVFWLGFIWFQKTRKGFADVL